MNNLGRTPAPSIPITHPLAAYLKGEAVTYPLNPQPHSAASLKPLRDIPVHLDRARQ